MNHKRLKCTCKESHELTELGAVRKFKRLLKFDKVERLDSFMLFYKGEMNIAIVDLLNKKIYID